MLKAILQTAVDDELLPSNPCRIKGAGKEEADERPVATVEQVFALADAMGPRWRLMVLTLAADTGAKLKDLMVRAGQSSERAQLIYQHSTVKHQQKLASGIDAAVRAERPGVQPSHRRA